MDGQGEQGLPIALATLIISITSRVDSIPPPIFERMRLNPQPDGQAGTPGRFKTRGMGGQAGRKTLSLGPIFLPLG